MSTQKIKSASTIFKIRNSIEPDTVLANRHGVSRKTIYNIRNGLRYASIPSPKTLRNYPNYNIYSDGTVEDRSTKKAIVSGSRALTKTVRLTSKSSGWVNVSVSDLVKQAFG